VTDLSGNPFGGINDDGTWNFRTTSAPLRIMCMGDSITTGYTDNPGWTNHPFKFGYRSGLYTRLTNADYNFLLVGGSTEPWTGISGDPTYGGTYKPALDLRDFGQDGHRGYGGKSASYLNSNILNWLASDNPDVILLKIGTNSQDQSGLNTLVNTITTTKPDCHLIVAQIMPKYTYQAGIVTYNTYIRDTLVPNYQALGRNVTVVDQYAPFLTNPAVLTSIDQSLFANGINHPDNDGYDKMAQVWFDAIEALRIGPNTFAKWITDPAFGIAPGQQGLDQDPDGDGIPNGMENFFGTHPGTCSRGLVADAVNGGGDTFTFTHPLNATPADNLTASYRWSKDLATFTADGNPLDGTTVTFTRGTPAAGVVTVTATLSGTPLDRLFVQVAVTQN
jgi:lysophospholipase L1-like esterase